MNENGRIFDEALKRQNREQWAALAKGLLYGSPIPIGIGLLWWGANHHWIPAVVFAALMALGLPLAKIGAASSKRAMADEYREEQSRRGLEAAKRREAEIRAYAARQDD